MLNGTYETLLPAIAASAAALIGLLFVAISVSGRHNPSGRPAVVGQVRAATSILAFTNAITVSLFGLVPGNNIGYPAAVVAVGGIFFTLAGARSIIASHLPRRYWPQQLSFVGAMLAIFAFELNSGLDLLHNPGNTSAAQELCDLLIILLVIGIARAWELVGDRDTGILASLMVLLAGREGTPADRYGSLAGPAADGDDPGDAERAEREGNPEVAPSGTSESGE